jgi:hypothetical protein
MSGHQTAAERAQDRADAKAEQADAWAQEAADAKAQEAGAKAKNEIVASLATLAGAGA